MSDYVPDANELGLLLAFYLRRDMAVQSEAGFGAFTHSPFLEDLTLAYEEARRIEGEADVQRLEIEMARAILADNRARLADIRLEMLETDDEDRKRQLLEDARAVAGEIRKLAEALPDTEH